MNSFKLCNKGILDKIGEFLTDTPDPIVLARMLSTSVDSMSLHVVSTDGATVQFFLYIPS